MNLNQLIPLPIKFETFKRNRVKFIPETSGCYVLTTFERTVLYIGLTNNLRRRMNEHLDNSEKIAETKHGRAVLIYWLDNNEINKVERTWLNIHYQHEGVRPILNNIDSPISV